MMPTQKIILPASVENLRKLLQDFQWTVRDDYAVRWFASPCPSHRIKHEGSKVGVQHQILPASSYHPHLV